MFRLTDKVVFLTGCGSVGPGWGNGKSIAVLFARQGARIFGVDINEAAARETQAIIQEEGGTCEVATGDVTDSAEVARLVEACMARFGRIDVLVNNVGKSEPAIPGEMDEALWDSQLAVNLKSAFLCCQAVLPIMQKQGKGAVVSIAYSAAKAGLIHFSKTTAITYAPQGIRMNCVLPGLMYTPLVAKLAEQFAGGDLDGFVAKRNAAVPIGHMGEGWDVAHAALFLASDEAKYVTATELVVDGGLTASTR
jgi:NAD(P)-dependent dehydrogenase (short-subunit alcohol dehydrogenase family)